MCTGRVKTGDGDGELTGDGANAVIERLLIATGDRSKGFVADGEDDDGDEREEERSCRADVPLTENNAKVVGIPGEEHLNWWC